jgi:hypothetical protein
MSRKLTITIALLTSALMAGPAEGASRSISISSSQGRTCTLSGSVSPYSSAGGATVNAPATGTASCNGGSTGASLPYINVSQNASSISDGSGNDGYIEHQTSFGLCAAAGCRSGDGGNTCHNVFSCSYSGEYPSLLRQRTYTIKFTYWVVAPGSEDWTSYPSECFDNFQHQIGCSIKVTFNTNV